MRTQKRTHTYLTQKAVKSVAPKEATICKAFYKRIVMLQKLNYFPKPFFIFHIPNERQSHAIVKINLKLMGVTAGISDYCFIYEGGCGFIEWKRDAKCKLSKPQQAFKDTCQALRVPFLQTHDIEEAIEFIKKTII